MISLKFGKCLTFLCCLLLSLVLGSAVTAQPAAQVVDVNTSQEQETIVLFLAEPFAALDDELLYTSDDGVHGIELWKTDGTAAGSVLVKDICPGACGAMPRALTRLGGRIVFFANDGEHGWELWSTDGTAEGTTLIKDVRPGLEGGADTAWMMEAGGKVFFPANDGVVGHELWTSDGTAAGTVLVKDLRPGPEDSMPVAHAAAGGQVLLDADDGVHGREPWITDGTSAGTHLVKDIRPGSAGATFSVSPFGQSKVWLATSGGLFLFQADDGTHGIELWASDGTEAGTSLIQDFYPGATGGSPAELTEMAGTVFFMVATDTLGYELWRTDGTPAGTSPVRDIRPGSGHSSPRDLTVFAGRLFFRAFDDAHGIELWASDGTEAGTVLVKDIRPGTDSSAWSSLGCREVAGQLLFFANDGTNGLSVWKTDGTEAGTVLVSNFGGQAIPTLAIVSAGPLALNGRLYFRAFDLNGEIDLWASDGTAGGTVEVAETSSPTSSIQILPWEGSVIEPSAWGAVGSKLVYLADDGTTGNEPWVSDGTAAGTQQLAETLPGTDWSYFSDLTPLGNGSSLFSTGPLWVTNATPAGTGLLFPGGNGPGASRELTRIGGTVYFSGASTAEGQELWKTDGTAAGTALVKEILPGTAGANPAELTAVGGTLFFVANGGPGERNQELWKSDGTADGTVLVKDVRPGAEPSGIEHPTPVGSRLFFTADDGTSGREPWVSDGTAAGTYLVKDIVSGAGSSIFSVGTPGPDITAALGSTFVFVADDGLSGQELWLSDGTSAGTYRLKDIRPGARGSEPRSLTVAGDRLLFTADDGTHGRELWVSDGTEAGTRMVEDLLPGAGSSFPRELTAMGEVVAFSATDGVHGVEPWASNGSWVLSLGDLAPGALPSTPVRFTLVGDLVYFGANDGTSGTELWAIPRSALTGPLDFYTVSPCRLIDTRGSAPLLADQPRTFTLAGSCGIPAAAKAVAVNLTAVSPTGPGYLIAWPTGTPRPGTSNLNYSPGLNRSNNGLVQLDGEGRINVVGMTFGLNGEVHLVVDVMGYFR